MYWKLRRPQIHLERERLSSKLVKRTIGQIFKLELGVPAAPNASHWLLSCVPNFLFRTLLVFYFVTLYEIRFLQHHTYSSSSFIVLININILTNCTGLAKGGVIDSYAVITPGITISSKLSTWAKLKPQKAPTLMLSQ